MDQVAPLPSVALRFVRRQDLNIFDPGFLSSLFNPAPTQSSVVASTPKTTSPVAQTTAATPEDPTTSTKATTQSTTPATVKTSSKQTTTNAPTTTATNGSPTKGSSSVASISTSVASGLDSSTST